MQPKRFTRSGRILRSTKQTQRTALVSLLAASLWMAWFILSITDRSLEHKRMDRCDVPTQRNTLSMSSWWRAGLFEKAVEEIIFREMRERNLYLPIRVINPVKDKAVRARPFQKRLRGQGLRFNKRLSGMRTMRMSASVSSLVPKPAWTTSSILPLSWWKGFDNQASPEEGFLF